MKPNAMNQMHFHAHMTSKVFTESNGHTNENYYVGIQLPMHSINLYFLKSGQHNSYRNINLIQYVKSFSDSLLEPAKQAWGIV